MCSEKSWVSVYEALALFYYDSFKFLLFDRPGTIDAAFKRRQKEAAGEKSKTPILEPFHKDSFRTVASRVCNERRNEMQK